MADGPSLVIGWQPITFKGPRRRCVRCSRRIRSGIVNIHHADGNALCHWCYREIMQTPTPESFHPENN